MKQTWCKFHSSFKVKYETILTQLIIRMKLRMWWLWKFFSVPLFLYLFESTVGPFWETNGTTLFILYWHYIRSETHFSWLPGRGIYTKFALEKIFAQFFSFQNTMWRCFLLQSMRKRKTFPVSCSTTLRNHYVYYWAKPKMRQQQVSLIKSNCFCIRDIKLCFFR